MLKREARLWRKSEKPPEVADVTWACIAAVVITALFGLFVFAIVSERRLYLSQLPCPGTVSVGKCSPEFWLEYLDRVR